MELDLPLGDIWVYLSTGPLLHLTLTVLAYLVGDWIFRRSGQKALFNPVLLSILLLVAILGATGTDYQTYFAGAQFVLVIVDSVRFLVSGVNSLLFNPGYWCQRACISHGLESV